MHKIFKILIALVVAVNFSLGDENIENNFNFDKYYHAWDKAIKNPKQNSKNAVYMDMAKTLFTGSARDIEKYIKNNKLDIVDWRELLYMQASRYISGNQNLNELDKIINVLVQNGANLNGYLKKGDSDISFLFEMTISSASRPHKKLEVIKLLQSKGLDIKAPVSHKISANAQMFAPLVAISINLDENFEIFEYLAQNQVNPEQTLSILIDKILDRKSSDKIEITAIKNFTQSPKYKENLKKYEKFLDTLANNYKMQDFKEEEFGYSTLLVAMSGDSKLGAKFVKMGLSKDSQIYKNLTQTPKTKQIVDSVFFGD